MDNYGTNNMPGNQQMAWNQPTQMYGNYPHMGNVNQGQMQNMNISAPRFNPPNSMSNQPMITPIQGRVINNLEEVKPDEVPMSGDWVFFPASNGREIYAMSWNLKSGIVSNHYILDTENSSASGNTASTEAMLSQIMDRLSSMEAEIKKINNYRKKSYVSNQKPEKKEDNENA